MNGVEIQTVNYSGHTFTDYFVAPNRGNAPGWFVYGRNAEKYGKLPDGRGAYVALVARPDVKPHRHPHYNCQVRRGWHTKREAQAIADAMNAGAA